MSSSSCSDSEEIDAGGGGGGEFLLWLRGFRAASSSPHELILTHGYLSPNSALILLPSFSLTYLCLDMSHSLAQSFQRLGPEPCSLSTTSGLYENRE